MTMIQVTRIGALTGYFGLWLLIPVWYIWLTESQLPLGLILGFLLVPLLFPLRGLLRNNTYTYAWSTFLSLLYFAHGVSEAWTIPQDRLYAGLEIFLSVLWFVSAMYYVKLLGKKNKAHD